MGAVATHDDHWPRASIQNAKSDGMRMGESQIERGIEDNAIGQVVKNGAVGVHEFDDVDQESRWDREGQRIKLIS